MSIQPTSFNFQVAFKGDKGYLKLYSCNLIAAYC